MTPPLDPVRAARVERRIRQLRGYLRRPDFVAVQLRRDEIEDIVAAFDAGWRLPRP